LTKKGETYINLGFKITHSHREFTKMFMSKFVADNWICLIVHLNFCFLFIEIYFVVLTNKWDFLVYLNVFMKMQLSNYLVILSQKWIAHKLDLIRWKRFTLFLNRPINHPPTCASDLGPEVTKYPLTSSL